ncbi:MAG TPA: rhomboid family intramembrane serine protease [Flavisolibacter sp.]
MLPISLILILANCLVSWKGFNDRNFYERYEFSIEKVKIYKQYYRLVTSGFLHVNWMHLIFNMIALYFFSSSVEFYFGPINFLLIYFTSMVGGDLLSLFIHRYDSSYSSVGASGAVSGVIYASIAVFPGMKMGFFFIPISIPAWIFGLGYVAYSIYGIRSRRDNVGHESHLAGALIGMLLAVAMFPAALTENYLTIGAIGLPSIIFIYIILTRPHVLLIDNQFFKTQKKFYSVDHRYNAEKVDRQMEVDRILDKINKRGMKSLTPKEKEILEQYSKTVR